MTTAKIILVATLIFTALFFAFVFYFGGFKQIEIQIQEAGGEVVVYQEIIGDYRQTARVMDDIYYALLHDKNIETYKGFGIYYDNPQYTPKSQLRSEAGCVVEFRDTSKLVDLPANFKVKYLPVQKYMVTEFPYLGKLSVLFSLNKVYPALNIYATAYGYHQDGSITEIYDIPGKRIIYRKAFQK